VETAGQTRRRATTAEALIRRLRGDLETIVAKTLKKNPAERYASVTALADDLRRYLSHEPIRARPDSLPYRVGKFVRRNRIGVAGAALIVAAALVGGVGIAWQASEAARQRDLARAQLDRATAANEFLGFLITDATPSGKKVSASDLFAQGERLVEKQFADNPALRAEMLAMIGDRYMVAENWGEAVRAFERSVEIARDPGVRAQGLCSIALANMASGKRHAARSTIQKALVDLPDDPQYALSRAVCLIRSSELGYYDFDADPTIRDAREALRILETSPATSVAARIDAQSALAYGYYLKLDYDQADRAYEELMAVLKRAGRENTLAAAEAVTKWGEVHFDGDVVKAEPLFRLALELHRSIDGSDAVAPTCLHNYALALSALARYDEAEALFQEAIRNARARGDRRVEWASTVHLADLHIERGELARAAAELDGLDDGSLSAPMAARPRRGHLAYSRGILSLAGGDARGARDLLTEAVEEYRDADSLEVDALTALSRAERSLGRPAAAAAVARQAIELAETFVPKGAPSYLIGRAEEELGEAELAAGDVASARASLCSAFDQLERTLGPGHPAAARARRRAESLPS